MLETIGLILAIVDFAGWTAKLEVWIVKFREVFMSKTLDKLRLFFMPDALSNHTEEENKKTERNENKHIIFVWSVILIYSVICFFLPPIKNLILWKRIIGSCISSFITIAITYTALLLCLYAFYYLILIPLYLILKLMGMPRRGTVGSIGLLLAIISFITREL